MSEPESTTAAATSREGSSRRRIRRVLLWAGPVAVLLVAGFYYFTSGRYVGTDNAYLKADTVTVSAQVDGVISRVAVAENEPVATGQVLFEIDAEPYRLALQRADAELANARSELVALKAQYRQSQRQLQLAQSNLDFARRELDRQLGLDRRKLTSRAAVDQARHNVEQATRAMQVSREQEAQILAQLGGDADTPVEQLPRYRQALAAQQQAALDLRHTTVRAPFAGVATNTPEPGAYVKPGGPIMSVVGTQRIWVVANFKETDLTHVRPGQPVTIHVDAYPDHDWRGTVASVSQATGAEFSVLPAQNATGNWVKVVQRIPVRISVDPDGNADVLRAGMSTEVSIDTGRYRAIPGFARAMLDRLGVLSARAAESADRSS